MKLEYNFVEEQYGEIGTSKRDKFEKGYETFKIGFLLQQARLEKGMTQEELGLGGHLEVSIKL